MDPQLRVFVVEDEALLQMQLEIFLEEAGHLLVGSATSLAEAIAHAEAAMPDLALVDIHLADGPTGVAVGRALADRGIPVVFMTANARRIPGRFLRSHRHHQQALYPGRRDRGVALPGRRGQEPAARAVTAAEPGAGAGARRALAPALTGVSPAHPSAA